VIATTDRRAGILRRVADEEGLKTLPVPEGVGGRFSVLSAVGLLPIAAAGLDIARLCEGARAMDVRTSVVDPWRKPAALHAALLWLAATKHGANIHVVDAVLRRPAARGGSGTGSCGPRAWENGAPSTARSSK
jgi:glucose-6-phosphate isomerase